MRPPPGCPGARIHSAPRWTTFCTGTDPHMIPLGDENPTLRTPWMTWLIIGVTVAVWTTVQGAGM